MAARKPAQPPLFAVDAIDALFRGAPEPVDLFPDVAPAAPAPQAATIRCTVCTQRNAQARPGVQVCVLCAADVAAARAQLAARREILTQRFDAALAAWLSAYSAASDDTRARYDRLDAARRNAGLWPDLRPMQETAPWQPSVNPELVKRSVLAAVAKGDALSDLLTAESRHSADVRDLEHLRAAVEAAEREIDALTEEE